MENNQFNTNNVQCDSSVDASCNDKVIKHDHSQTAIVLAGAGLNGNDYGVGGIIANLGHSGQNYKGTNSHLVIELDAVDSELKYTFNFLSRKLDTQIKHHLKKISVSYDSSGGVMYHDKGGLKYDGKIFYVKELHNEEASGVPVSPSNDDSLGYKFFMYRLITSSKAYKTKDADGNLQSREYKISPTHVVTFDKKTDEGYTPADVMTQFKYVDEKGNYIETHIGSSVNKKAYNVMVADREELKNLITKTFAQYQTHCNTLKNVDDAYKEAIIKGVCGGAYERDDQDYFVQYVTCRELFTLASIDKFCPDMIKEVPDYFDEL